MTLRVRIIRELRARRFPISTGDLARLCCGARSKHARFRAQYTLTELRRLQRCGVVRQHPPKVTGEGRPSLRWTLVRGGALQPRAA